MKQPATARLSAILIALLFLSAGVLCAQQDSRYDSGMNLPFNEKAGEVNPQTGNLSLAFTDVVLPGRAGHAFTFGRVWALNRSQVFQAGRNGVDGANQLYGETVEGQHHLGVGWTSSLPAILSDHSSGGEVLELFYGEGVYELDRAGMGTENSEQSNILGYDLLDLRVQARQEVTYGEFGAELAGLQSSYGVSDQGGDANAYLLTLADHSIYYFRPDGKLMMHQDKSGANRIWYFYNGGGQLVVAVDTVGRRIRFGYDGVGNLITVQWEVRKAVKNAEDGSRQWVSETRTVRYAYESVAALDEVSGLVGQVLDYHEPYRLVSVTNPAGQVTRYGYQAGSAEFTYNGGRQMSRNVYLMLTDIKEVYEAESGAYRSGRTFRYEVPAEGMYRKPFWGGSLEYYRLSGQEWQDRHGRPMQATRYVYQEAGADGDLTHYRTVIEQGNVRRTYTYIKSGAAAWNNVLESLETGSRDGYLELIRYSYAADRTKTSDSVSRQGHPAYEEKYSYDRKGNLTQHIDRLGLTTDTFYDGTYSLPIQQLRSFTPPGGAKQIYQKDWTLTARGQVQRETVSVGGRAIPVATYGYDEWGNVVSVTDAAGNVVTTDYDALHHTYPVRSRQTVTRASWSTGAGVEEHWKDSPDSSLQETLVGYKVFNSDGSVWLEVDPQGAVVEHYYDTLGAEIETVAPDDDDPAPWDTALVSDFSSDWLSSGGNWDIFFAARSNNARVRQEIDYRTDRVKTSTDLDHAAGQVKVTGVQKDGLGHSEEEIEYGAGGTTVHAVKTMVYDSLGRMVSLTDPDAGASSVPMKVNGMTVQRHDSTWVVSYDDLGRQVRVLYPQTAGGRTDTKQKFYNDQDNTVTTYDPAGRKAVEHYDWAGHLVKLVAYGDAATGAEAVQSYATEYDSLGRKVAFLDPLGQRTEYRYDERDLLVEQVYGDGSGSDKLSYDDRGLLVKRVDRKGQVIAFDYDEAGRAVRERRYASEAAVAGGNPLEAVDSLYDRRGKIRRVANGALTERYRYNASGQLVELERRVAEEAIRQAVAGVWGGSEAGQTFLFGYRYNDSGMLTRMSYPDGSVHEFSYDGTFGRLAGIAEGATADTLSPFVSGVEYNKGGVVTRLGYSNGAEQRWQFDSRKRISRIQVNGPSAVSIEDLRYTVNGVGDILSINENEYRYDGFDRIVGARTLNPGCRDAVKQVESRFGTYAAGDPIDGAAYTAAADLDHNSRVNGADYLLALAGSASSYDEESFAYDLAGNRTELVQNGAVYRYEYSPKGNRLARVYRRAAGGGSESLVAEYRYDANGNTTQRTLHLSDGGTQSTTFAYDILNRLVSTTCGSEVSEYRYDIAGNRLWKKASNGALTLYLRHGQLAVALEVEVAASGAANKGEINRYLLSGDLIAGQVATTVAQDGLRSSARRYYHLDHLNSTKVVTDASAAVVVRYSYRAFGEQLKRLNGGGVEVADLATYSYSGKELDDGTNLYYFNARYYDATIGRFINVDPIQDGSNWYVYCNNNPLCFKDPTGLRPDPGTGVDTVDKIEKRNANIMSHLSKLSSSKAVSSGLTMTEEFSLKFAGDLALKGSSIKKGGNVLFWFSSGGRLPGNLVNDQYINSLGIPAMGDGDRLIGQSKIFSRAGMLTKGLGLAMFGLEEYNALSEQNYYKAMVIAGSQYGQIAGSELALSIARQMPGKFLLTGTAKGIISGVGGIAGGAFMEYVMIPVVKNAVMMTPHLMLESASEAMNRPEVLNKMQSSVGLK